MQHKKILFSAGLFSIITLIVVSCSKDAVAINPPLPGVKASASFVEEFDTVGNLTAKGWIFKNNSFPIGASGWRQGRYEPSTGAQYKFVAPVSYYGFPAFSAHNTPNDFVSCDVTAGNDNNANTSANISAWLISPVLPMKNGDSITFYTRAVDDANYSVYLKDRMQVRANFSDGSANVGGSTTTVGSFTTLLRDINPNYIDNDPAGNTSGAAGYPRAWTKYKIVISGITDSIANGRFAFRYMSTDAGLYGGSTGDNYPSVVGIDSLLFGRK